MGVRSVRNPPGTTNWAFSGNGAAGLWAANERGARTTAAQKVHATRQIVELVLVNMADTIPELKTLGR